MQSNKELQKTKNSQESAKLINKNKEFALITECTNCFIHFIVTGNDAYLEEIKMRIDAYKRDKILGKHQIAEIKKKIAALDEKIESLKEESMSETKSANYEASCMVAEFCPYHQYPQYCKHCERKSLMDYFKAEEEVKNEL